jgi:hypothetical protein
MLHRAAALALTLTMAFVSLSPGTARAQAAQAASPWQRTDSQHFEIHYPPALAPELDRVVQSAERAYDRIAGRLHFVMPTKVPLVVYASSGSMTRAEIRAYTGSAQVAPAHPHRSRLDLPLLEGDAQFDALIVHELTHILVSGLVWQDRIGDGGLPYWIKEGVAEYMVGAWRDEDVRQMRELVASRDVPALSQLSGSGGFTNARVNNAIGHAAFDYIESRWGPNGIRRFLDALIMPRVSKTYDTVFDLPPEDFDIAFREYAVQRFGQGVH